MARKSGGCTLHSMTIIVRSLGTVSILNINCCGISNRMIWPSMMCSIILRVMYKNHHHTKSGNFYHLSKIEKMEERSGISSLFSFLKKDMVVAMLCIVPTSEVKIINLIYAKVLKLLKAFLVASRQTHYSKSVIFVQ